MGSHNLKPIDKKAVNQRLLEALVYRGFKTAAQVYYFFESTIDELEHWLNFGEGRRNTAAKLGISNAWLSFGTDNMLVIPQKTWEARQAARGFRLVGNTIEFHRAAIFHTTKGFLQPPPAPPRDRLSAAEQEAVDTLWDPSHAGRDLLLLGAIAEGKPGYGRRHDCQTTVISAARMGFCLALDHDKGLATRDDLKEAVRELRWHEFQGLGHLLGARPAVTRGIVEEYDGVLHICERVITRVAQDLKIDRTALEPKAPVPDWHGAGVKDARPAP